VTTLLHRVHAGLSARREGTRFVLMRWQMLDEIAMPVPVAVFTVNEWIETVCALTPAWETATPKERELVRSAVTRIVEGQDRS
jgi:hypothetical protein